MKEINERFYITDNGILFDAESNMAIRVFTTKISEVVKKLGEFNDMLNYKTLKDAHYSDGSNFAININLTSACNLNCTYCFARGGDYGEQKDNMSEAILPTLKDLILQNVTSSRKVRFEYFGGEPLLNEKMIEHLVSFAKDLEKETGIKVLHRISTNLTILSDKMLNLLCENNFVVSVSIDGKKEIQDLQRPSRNSKSSYDIILNNVERIKKANSSVKMVARMTIAQKEVSIFENVFSLVKTRLFDYVSVYPASVLSSDGSYSYYFDDEVQKQYKELFERYSELFDVNPMFRGFLEIEKTLDEILSGKLSISHCSAGGNYCTLSSDGSIVTCHRLCGNKKYMMNTAESGVLNSDLKDDWSRKVLESKTCSNCFARYICGGGCKQEHISATGNFIDKNLNACRYRQFFIEEIISNINTLADHFEERYISLDDMFVYCGRPVISNHRKYPEVENGVKIYGQ